MDRTLLGLVCCVFFLVAGPVYGGELALLLNGRAVHLAKSPKHKNEANYGFGFEYDFDTQTDWRWFAFGSGFRDSRENPSYNAGGGIRRRYFVGYKEAFVDLGVAGMLMTRETYLHGRPFPVALPVASVGMGNMAVNIAYVPEVDPRIIPLVFFQLKYVME